MKRDDRRRHYLNSEPGIQSRYLMHWKTQRAWITDALNSEIPSAVIMKSAPQSRRCNSLTPHRSHFKTGKTSKSIAPLLVPPAAGEKKVGVFLSHKHDDYLAATRVTTKLQEYGGDNLEVHLSELIPAGEQWNLKIHQWLQDSDWLLLLYTGPGVEWDWCLYETGFFAGVHGIATKRLVCLHRDGVTLPDPLKAWEAVTEKNCVALLSEIFREAPRPGAKPINSKITDETLKDLANCIMRAVTEKPKPLVLTPYIELVLENRQREELRSTGKLAGDIAVTVGIKAGEIFGFLDSAGERTLCRSDITCQLEETRQKGWGSAVSDSIRRLCRKQSASTTFPIVYSATAESRRRWRPILYSVQLGGAEQVFRIVFSEIRPEDDPRPTDSRLDHCTALMAASRMIRFGVIDKYRPLVRSLQLRKQSGEAITQNDFDDRFASLPAVVDRIETEAMNAGLQTLDNVLELFAATQAEQRKQLEAWTPQWIERRKQLANGVAARNLDELEAALDDMRDLNRDSFRLIAHRYCELIDELK